MSVHSINLPEYLYLQLETRAKQAANSVEEFVIQALVQTISTEEKGVVHFRRTIRFTFLQREKMFIFSTLSHAQAENDLI
ncbi:hypothetical protein KFU94_64745 [Chloroflexi bacterium TSY]|nr:hypothetical protein [Chloroflexi bacterium TSY]